MTTSLKKVLIPIGTILILVLVALSLIKSQLSDTHQGANMEEVRVGTVLPDFTLDRFQGGPLQVSKFIQENSSKVILVNFWATWCEACMVEMPSIMELRDQFKNQGFEVIALNVDENPEVVVPKTVERLGLNLPMFIDKDSRLAELFDVHAIPFTVLIDENRKVLHIETGERDWNDNEIQEKVRQWISE